MDWVNVGSAILQGLTEFFPVSSDGHLSLFSNLVSSPDFSFIVFLHFASLLAIISFCFKDIIRLLHFKKEDLRYILFLIVGIIPAAIAGYLFSSFFSGAYTLLLTGVCFMINGVFVFLSKYTKQRRDIGFGSAVGIGLMQIFALLPGISRSGMTISTAKFFGVRNKEAFRFSFLMAIPLIFGAVVFESKNIVLSTNLLLPFIICLGVSLFSLVFLKKVIDSNKFWVFGIYCWVIGILTILLAL